MIALTKYIINVNNLIYQYRNIIVNLSYYILFMKRIEIHLTSKEVKKLDTIAKNEGRSRKNYCETQIRKCISNIIIIRQKSKNK